MNFLRLRRTPKLAVPKHATEILFADADGVLKQMGPDGSVVEVGSGGGGGSMPVTESCYYTGGAVTIANNATGTLTFDASAGDTETLDISTPTAPTVLKAGLFVVSVEVEPTAFTPSGSIILELTLDLNGAAIAVRNTGTADAAGGRTPWEVSGSWVMEAGAVLRLRVSNFDGVSSRNFLIKNATVSRVGPA